MITHDLVVSTGNVTEITNAAGASAATYRYDAFGNTLTAAGPYAATNRYRFSTKPLDAEVVNAPLYYYGYRFYDLVTGRWPSRDPIGDEGGINLYGFVNNNGVNYFDLHGLKQLDLVYNILDLAGVFAVDGPDDAVAEAGRIPDAIQVLSIGNLIEDMRKRIRKYKSDGLDPCDCVKTLIIWTHGDSTSSVFFGGPADFWYSPASVAQMKTTEAFLARPDITDAQRKLAQAQVKANILISKLREINSLLCDDANVEIRACHSGLVDGATEAWEEVFTKAKEVKTYKGKVAPDGERGRRVVEKVDWSTPKIRH